MTEALRILRGPAPEATGLPTKAPPQRLLWSAAELSQVLGVSVRTIRRLELQARLPRPLVIGRAVKWKADEIRRWVNARCPSRDEWELIERETNGRPGRRP